MAEYPFMHFSCQLPWGWLQYPSDEGSTNPNLTPIQNYFSRKNTADVIKKITFLLYRIDCSYNTRWYNIPISAQFFFIIKCEPFETDKYLSDSNLNCLFVWHGSCRRRRSVHVLFHLNFITPHELVENSGSPCYWDRPFRQCISV